MMTELEKHYNKFNEDKRLTRRRGQVEFITSMKYIHECINVLLSERKAESQVLLSNVREENLKVSSESEGSGAVGHESDIKILDVGAGTGRYSVQLSEEGFDVTAVELVKYNLGILKSKESGVKAYLGNALNLSRFEDDSFDLTLVFGPMYHLFTMEDKVKALKEAKRVTKEGGFVLVAYYMNEYGVLTHGFLDGNIKESIAKGKLSEDFHCIAMPEDLYDRVRTEDIQAFNEEVHLQRVKLVAADGPAHYIRKALNAMDEETFDLFLKYHLSTCERQDLIGASTHTLDILRV